ncbi:MAG TPA: 30S ribosomal protein S12 methylthiotransferase RimO, partial [Candidatus Saccharimonadales bacterium]|nr:30S ribosomal protein S12 methylthiotransferase RimO [Candidatus Saccharimonadales bacterium]
MITVGLVSLGCAKNQVDSEVMLGILRRRGHEITHRPEQADVIVVNTCGFLEAAREEGVAVIREMARHKSRGRCRRLVVTGCLVQRRAEELRASLPEVDQFLALNDVERIAEACEPGAAPFEPDLSPATWLHGARSRRVLTSAGPSAYLKIAEGCDNPCAFCVIPAIRGRFRSRSLESLVEEARDLTAAGARELNLIAQDSTSWGEDLRGTPRPAALLRALSAVEGVRWVRLLYAYPNRLSRDLIEALGSTPGVVPYLDVPLQHASRAVLARMRRGGSAGAFLRMLDSLRARVPGISLRSTFIVGFPGETEAEFEELRAFVERAGFDHIGVFTYSHEPGAPSADLDDDVPADLKSDRRQVLLDLQEGIAAARYRRLVGSELEVLVEGRGPEAGTLTGRAAFQAPEVDGSVVFRPGAARTDTPAFARVVVEEAWPYALYGRETAVPA